MTAYRPIQTATVEAIRLGSTGYAVLVTWLQANYGGAWAIEGDPTAANTRLAVDTPIGRVRASVGQWLVSNRPADPVLDVLDDTVFSTRYELVPP